MNTILVLCLAVFVHGDTYTDKFDSMDIDEILNNCGLLSSYEKCILGQRACTKEGKELKSHIKDAIDSRCAKCTEAQKEKIKHASCVLANCQSAFWTAARAIYDPNDTHMKANQEEYDKVIKCNVDCTKYCNKQV